MEEGREINIVLIDGNEFELMLISEALKKLHIIYRIIPFNSTQKALEYLEVQKNTQTHLIIADSDTMHLSGESFVARLRSSERLRKIPLWILTDDESEEAFFTYLNLPAKSFIRKPAVFKRYKQVPEKLDRFIDEDMKNRFN